MARARRLGGGGSRRLHAAQATASLAFSALQNGQKRMGGYSPPRS